MRDESSESFESVYRELEEVVRRLDEGGLTLDESIGLYEQGMMLAQRCQGLLESAELRVTRLQELFVGAGRLGEDVVEDDDED
jgi:exodeoxyribonuclease VII small subunit